MEILQIKENSPGKGALLTLNLEEEEIRLLLEIAVNEILKKAINNEGLLED